MAEPIFCTTADVETKVGAGASAVSKAEAYVLVYGNMVESFINSTCRYNFSDNYAGLNVDTKGILRQVSSDLIAIYVICYDMSGYPSRIVAEDMINVLRDRALAGLNLLKDKKVQEFIKETA